MNDLAKGYLRKNNDMFRYIKMANNELLLRKVSKSLKELDPEPDNVYGNVIKSMIRLHSSKYHNDGKKDEKKKSLNDEFEEVMKELKKSQKLNNRNKEENDNILKYRKRMAFKYRYLSINKQKNNQNADEKILNIKKKNKKMKKLFKISKSIPYILLPKIYESERNDSCIYNDSSAAVSNRIQSSHFHKSINSSDSDKDNDNNNVSNNNINNISKNNIYKNYCYRKNNSFNFHNHIKLKKKNDDNSRFVSEKELSYDKATKNIHSYINKNEENHLNKKIVKTIEKDGNKYLRNLSILLS